MNALTKLALFTLTAGVAFAGAYGAGHVVGPLAAETERGEAPASPSGTGHPDGHDSSQHLEEG